MAKQFSSIEPIHREFIEKQRIFFTASAAAEGHINLSPKDAAALRVIDPQAVFYLDQTGSGNETAAHLLRDGRLTLMFCALDGPPMILRLYGMGRIAKRGSKEYGDLLVAHFAGSERPGARQMIVLRVELVQTSCGYGVPRFEYVEDRATLTRWAESKSETELEEYRRLKNTRSIDGFPTGIDG
ncbi:pyridoxamine 5'-phosphate oxidase family protein [Terriglobus albidus]|uniref:Pyridoxamine 5'-phosphate oxidase family protein n=1 Tax=Terriglobus albidus TaxID=1592106 RepID=A0A5B9EGI9_9BACT|nr:pyridoxamine 5'-phosphate oxidase family protein [Terriglobus albidus]QEE29551.1 pyridoxamine 5'-phosphate oxidase family protein [Terriglobus albidus]